MDRPYLSQQHGGRIAFMRAFSDALFVYNTKDKALLSARFEKMGSTWDFEFKRRRKYCLARCRRTIPFSDVIIPRLVEVMELFGPMQDAQTDKPLFNANVWKATRLVLEMVRDGFLSDPPDVALYAILRTCGGPDGTLRDGVVVYRCSRETNMTEGGVHQNLRRRFAKSGISI